MTVIPIPIGGPPITQPPRDLTYANSSSAKAEIERLRADLEATQRVAASYLDAYLREKARSEALQEALDARR